MNQNSSSVLGGLLCFMVKLRDFYGFLGGALLARSIMLCFGAHFDFSGAAEVFGFGCQDVYVHE